MDTDDQHVQDVLKERFVALPKVVQDAITSADIEKHLRELANIHKLHLDQWGALENEVMLAILGIQRMEDLEQHIKAEVGLDDATAHALAEDISRIVFAPVRQELERSLKSPDAIAATTTGVEDMRTQVLASSENKAAPASVLPVPTTLTSTVLPGTPPAAPATATVERAQISPAYIPATPSHERKTIEGDPYREQLK
jgi:hypothetical protein